MNDYQIETLSDDIKELVLAVRELNRIKKGIKAEKAAYGKTAVSARLAHTLAVIGERATGISQLGMNTDDPDIVNIVNKLIN